MSHSQPLITTDSLSLLDDHEETHTSTEVRLRENQSLLLCCRFSPSHLPLSIQELDENQIGRFSFSSEEAVVHVSLNPGAHFSDEVSVTCWIFSSQLLNRHSVENLQVTLACQVAQKNALISAVKLVCLCRRAESVTPSAEVGGAHDDGK